MTDFLFLQRFRAGEVEPLSWPAVLQELHTFGVQRQLDGGIEISVRDRFADAIFVVGDAVAGVSCIALLCPRYDEALRALVLHCLAAFGCVAFDDTLTRAFVPLAQAREAAGSLPPELARETTAVLRRVSDGLQLWPSWVESPVFQRALPYVLQGPAQEAGEVIRQRFDRRDPDGWLEVDLGMHPAACNSGTAGAFQLLQARVDHVMAAHPQFKVRWRYVNPETQLRIVLAPLTPGAVRFVVRGPLPWHGRGFDSERWTFESVSKQASDCARQALEEFGVSLDGSVDSVDVLDGVLDRLHEAWRVGGFSGELEDWTIRAGAYLSLIISRAIGGQIGEASVGGVRLKCVRMHTGTRQFPVLRVLDHIVNGPQDNVRAWFTQTAREDASATPREQDWVCNIQGYCDILLGRAELPGGGSLPLAESIPREQLDFSVESLVHLDRYLGRVRAQAVGSANGVDLNVMVTAGAYLGEVVRSRVYGSWIWVPYDHFAAMNAEFAQRWSRQPKFMAILDNEAQAFMPLAHVDSVLAGTADVDCHALVTALAAMRAKSIELPAIVEPLDAEPAFCPHCGHPMLSTAKACERCDARFDPDSALRPVAVAPPPPREVGRWASVGGAALELSRFFVQLGRIFLMGPVLHLLWLTLGQAPPVEAAVMLWGVPAIFYAASALLVRFAHSQGADAQRIESPAVPRIEHFIAAWDMNAFERLPIGLRVTHMPAKAMATRDGPGGKTFSWICTSSVEAMQEAVELKAFGAARWNGNRWVFCTYTGKPFTADDFAEWYACPDARLFPGQTYSDRNNWTAGDRLRPSMTRWCYVGVTQGGRLVRGEATAHHSGRMAA